MKDPNGNTIKSWVASGDVNTAEHIAAWQPSGSPTASAVTYCGGTKTYTQFFGFTNSGGGTITNASIRGMGAHEAGHVWMQHVGKGDTVWLGLNDEPTMTAAGACYTTTNFDEFDTPSEDDLTHDLYQNSGAFQGKELVGNDGFENNLQPAPYNSDPLGWARADSAAVFALDSGHVSGAKSGKVSNTYNGSNSYVHSMTRVTNTSGGFQYFAKMNYKSESGAVGNVRIQIWTRSVSYPNTCDTQTVNSWNLHSPSVSGTWTVQENSPQLSVPTNGWPGATYHSGIHWNPISPSFDVQIRIYKNVDKPLYLDNAGIEHG